MMWQIFRTDKARKEDHYATICLQEMIAFRDHIKLPWDTENYYDDKRKLSDYSLQQFREYEARKIKRTI